MLEWYWRAIGAARQETVLRNSIAEAAEMALMRDRDEAVELNLDLSELIRN